MLDPARKLKLHCQFRYAAYVRDESTITVYTNTTGVWGFRAIIIGY